MKEKWLNRITVVVFIVVLGLLAWWLFRPQPMPFALKARWKAQGGAIAASIAFSPKNDWLAAAVENFVGFTQGQKMSTVKLEVHLWRVLEPKATPKVLTVSQQTLPLFSRLAFSSDGRLLAVGYWEQGIGKVALFTVAEGRRLRTITMGKSTRMLAPAVTFAPDGRLAVVHDLQLWFVRVEDGKKTPTKIQTERIVFSPDGRWLAAVQMNAVSIYDANGHLVKQIQPISHTVVLTFLTAAFSKDGQRLVCLWRSKSQKLPSPNTRYGISVWQIPNWQSERSTPLTPFYEEYGVTRPAVFAPNLSLVALSEPDPSGWDGRIWQLERFVFKLLKRPNLSAPPTQLVVRRLSDGQVVAKLPRFGRDVWDCAFSPDGRYLAVSHVNTIALWERKGD